MFLDKCVLVCMFAQLITKYGLSCSVHTVLNVLEGSQFINSTGEFRTEFNYGSFGYSSTALLFKEL